MVKATLVSSVLFVAFAAACGSSSDDDSSPKVDWGDPDVVAPLTGSWTVAACDGAGNMLCVEEAGAHVSIVEAAAFPLDGFPMLDPGGEPEANIRLIAEDFVESFAADRAEMCGAGYDFRPSPVSPATLGGQRAWSFGFEMAADDGSPSEVDLHYATVVDDRIVMMVASAVDQGGCLTPDSEAGSFTSEDLKALRPQLELVLANSRLPTVISPY